MANHYAKRTASGFPNFQDYHINLVNESNRPQTVANFANQPVALFFGFTYCPDICPMTLETISNLIEKLDSDADKLNYYFISGPDKDEFDSILKPLSWQKNFYIFSSKSLSTDETLSCLKWLGRERNSINSIVITANSKKAISMGFNENCIVPLPESVGGRYSIWSPISLSAGIENNFSRFLKGGLAADKMILGTTKEDKQYQKFIKILAFSDLWFSNFKNKKNRKSHRVHIQW